MLKKLLPLFAAVVLFSCKNNPTAFKAIDVKYPQTKKDTTVKDDYFGTSVADPYRWLEKDTSAETAAWVKAETESTENYLKQVPYREAIGKRYEHLFNYEKFSAPTREGKYNYYSKNSGLQNQFVMYREPVEGGAAELFLDPNSFSKDGTTSLAGINFSKDGSMAAYNISEGGSDWQKIIVIDAINKKMVGDTMQDIKFSGASWKGNDGFFYSTYERPKEGSFLAGKTDNHKLYYHKIGTAQKDDKLIYAGKNENIRYIGSWVSEDQKWLFIFCANSTYGNNLLVLDLTNANAPVKTIVADMKNSHGLVTVDAKNIYIQTDRNAPTGKLMIAPLATPEEANWKVLIDAKSEVLNTSAAGGSLFCSYLKDAVSKVYQYDRSGKQVREIALPGLGSASGFGGKQDDKELFYGYTDYITPYSIYKMNIASGKAELYKQPKVEFKPEEYESKQVFYPSKDGTKIPMIITYKKALN